MDFISILIFNQETDIPFAPHPITSSTYSGPCPLVETQDGHRGGNGGIGISGHPRPASAGRLKGAQLPPLLAAATAATSGPGPGLPPPAACTSISSSVAMAAAAPGSGGAPSWSPPHELVSQTVTLLLVLRDPTNPQVRLLYSIDRGPDFLGGS